MNIIEKLGGYEKAKEITEDDFFKCFTHVSLNGKRGINEEFSFIPHLNEALKEMVRISDIKEALLEYRRQYNIFEVGDYVVYADNEFYVVVGIQGGRNIAVKDINSNFTMSVVFKHCRHATDAEIKAGKRL